MTSKAQAAKNTAIDTELSKQYQKKTDKQHILDNPDTYIGSIENVDENIWVFDDAADKVVNNPIHYIPGLYKLFDEGIVNARDHVVRLIQRHRTDPDNTKFVSYINVDISADGTITIENDGNGIDVAKHPEYDVWIPEMIFGHLRTSTNYDKDEKRIVGGKNGFGFKLVLIWSEFGSVETVDHVRGLKYTQTFRQNLDVIEPPVITKVKGAAAKPYTKVVFKPDYRRFGIAGLTPDMATLFKKRFYDICAVTDQSEKKIKFTYNGSLSAVKNFQQYIDLYIGKKEDSKRVYEASECGRWEYAVAMAPKQEFTQVSFVNGICTYKGGKHVDYVVGQIVRKLADYIEKKKKVKVNSPAIKEQLILFLRCDIENPAFDSQTKDFMNTPSNKFGSSCSVSDAFIEKVAKMGVMDTACDLTQAKEKNVAAKKTDGSKTKNIRGIENFMDANYSGTEKSGDCILILCEGLSAMSGIVSGLSSTDRNIIGIYPLRGKLLNVRGETVKKISDNKEITDLKKILGLENSRVYESMEDVKRFLRYGKIMIMCDQDTDGSHIKGLCINLFHCEWKSLTQIPGFISFMNTPILRASRGSQTLSFYNDGEYQAWKTRVGGEAAGWKIKYFKGLGTSKSEEFKEYFTNKKIVDFVHSGESDDVIDKVFNDKRANDRKTWLIEKYDKDAFLDTAQPSVKYETFVDRELIHFSNYDCGRSIPCAIDGLKISLRKILFCAFKRRLTSEVKVAQFSGYVSEHSAYHHGEASLNGAIVNMAQNFVGSNNINLLEPNGQFGTRLQGGDDSASERYIFTMLNPLTRFIFPEADDNILTYINDDGTLVEPENYVPIIPFALVNGIKGIGTGFSCSVPPYNPADLIQYIKCMLTARPAPDELVPYYEGFKGTVRKIESDKYLITGVYEKVGDDTVVITELPIGKWTMQYTKFLEELVDGTVDKDGKKSPPIIKDFTSLCTEVGVHFTVVFPRGKLAELDVEKVLKLSTTIKTSNIHMFDDKCKLKKFECVDEIIREYYGVRLEAYRKRKAYLVDAMTKRMELLSNKAKYIEYTLIDKIDLRRKSADAVEDMLSKHAFVKIDGDYKYLVKMPMDSVTNENVERLKKERDDTKSELDVLVGTTLEQIWMKELEALEVEYSKYKKMREELQNADAKKAATDKKAADKKKTGKK
jgi:DNA topoisomerase-2